MPSVSKAQQHAFGMAIAIKEGKMDAMKAPKEIRDMAANMTHKQLKEFAATPTKGLPKKK